MAVSTPRRLIAEDASYGKISTPDGSRYESATAELGGMLTKEGADTIPTSEEMINILAADRLKLQTVSSQLFDRDQFIRQFAESECGDDIMNAITLSSSELKDYLQTLGLPSEGIRTRLRMGSDEDSGPKLSTEEVDMILQECAKLTCDLISSTVMPKVADLMTDTLLHNLPSIKLSDMTKAIDKSTLRDPMENEFISIIHTIMPLLKTCNSLGSQAKIMKEKIISNDSLRNLLAGEMACIEPTTSEHEAKIEQIKKIEEQNVKLQDHWDSIHKTQLGLKNDIHAHVIRYTGNVAPPKKSEKIAKPLALPGGSAGTPDPKLAKKIYFAILE